MKNNQESFTVSQYIKFLIPSIIGVALFLIPISVDGKVTIGLGILADGLQAFLGDSIPYIMTVIICLSAVGSLIVRVTNLPFIKKNSFLDSLLNIPYLWIIMRFMGAIFAVLTLTEYGPSFIWSMATGGTVLYDLIPVLMVWFLFACLFMPLLLQFGLMDFIGTVVRKIMYPLFKLPGRSSIDALASWMGSGTVGVLLTTQQYESGYYNKREAAVVATNFSIASIAFSLVIARFLSIDHLFVPFYVTVVVAGVVAAMLVPRVPPLSRKPDDYYEKTGKQIDEVVPKGVSSFRWGVEKAVEKADKVKSYRNVVKGAILNVFDIWFALIPLVMALGTVALIIAEKTPIFNYLSYPFIPFLQLLQIPEAEAAAPAMIVGFADMFLPAVIGSGIESELTRFVIGVMSLAQLIYMSEIGILLIKSKIPLSIFELFIIFLQRTIITLPVVALMAHLFFF
ncbi:nucleoside recognition domain-containing protein [Gracilibacillus halophilus YIM-C55.5]|uniref:Nucleoside recognition domain-containing protein n=1 Tax=Gracilibacillus halophilus YIM-C55.5 TaxID=1308866 RepID=N4WPV2_9BACI|nr:YjiH family protein [Gracilibacillus halophilus]ENH98142.1 nucleoside recognition domain-containing protein [Gracilibacillus halophilus YIM-C55.5]